MDRAHERVAARLEGRHVVRLLGNAVELVALPDLLAGTVLDRDVVRGARVLVVEGDLEGRAGGRAQARRVERDVLRLEIDDGSRSAGCRSTCLRRSAGHCR